MPFWSLTALVWSALKLFGSLAVYTYVPSFLFFSNFVASVSRVKVTFLPSLSKLFVAGAFSSVKTGDPLALGLTLMILGISSMLLVVVIRAKKRANEAE